MEAEEKMTDRELAAALGRVGLWGATEVEQLVALRQVRREEARELREEFGRPHGRPVNANKASIEEMQQLPGVAPDRPAAQAWTTARAKALLSR